MKNLLLLTALLITFISCTQEKKIPELKTQRISDESLQLIGFDSIQTVASDESNNLSSVPECVNDLIISSAYYRQQNDLFSLNDFKKKWENCQPKTNVLEWKQETIGEWIEATGLLLQLTTDAKYAAELEQIYLIASDSGLKEQAASYVVTKNVDHLHLNLFLPAQVEYEHSLGGKVKVAVETGYPANGRTELLFRMEKKRYIELQIRIPEWANDAHVTVKGVKYFAPAGDYCFIAKQWKEGDMVEIEFPSIRNQPVI